MYLFSGRAEVFLDDEPAYTVESGQVTLLRPGRREREGLTEELELADLAASVGVIPAYLIRLYRDRFGSRDARRFPEWAVNQDRTRAVFGTAHPVPRRFRKKSCVGHHSVAAHWQHLRPPPQFRRKPEKTLVGKAFGLGCHEIWREFGDEARVAESFRIRSEVDKRTMQSYSYTILLKDSS